MMVLRSMQICDDCDAAVYDEEEDHVVACSIVVDTITYRHRGRCPFKDNIIANKGTEDEWCEILGDIYGR